ncbi:nucleotidyltransferase domain-containing protein [Sphingobium phenoxybenzoativorans]|uniref:Nucleotidyltransferase domain-containing protein n=1 Tax=Sphingobium phenoxybenzoativorans TaxID=1592790 RepID=A0A975K6W1_9SPHN|nr:nucleotidyltransferase domain-containing protein [Sphingobium phenoxybenzoativorans]QUT05903.1 nucleotidyltransferase domain-containing protein [Sphingobium phenoxybenzoativorans]
MLAPLRSIPEIFDPVTVAQIDARLDEIEASDHVVIGWAIESGSRAWGFPSPDSDYDCRFIYVRRQDDYLSPWMRRDVIETPLDGVLDVNGWDLGKAVKLLLKGNAVVIEWLTSPIAYRGDIWLRDALLDLARRYTDRDAVARHYLHLGEAQRRKYFSDEKDVALKKLFYALRPAASLRWMRHHPGERIAPMHFPTLMEQCEPSAEVRSIVAELIARKAASKEMGSAPLPQPIRAFVDDEFKAARACFASTSQVASAEARTAAERLFRAAIRRYALTS